MFIFHVDMNMITKKKEKDEEDEEEVAACSICHVLFGMVVLEDTRSTAGQKDFALECTCNER